MMRVPRSAALVLVAAVAAVGLYAGAVLLGVFSNEYGFHPDADAHVWAVTPRRYSISTTCTRCHAPQATALASARHAPIGCQSCHGPLEAHAIASIPDSTTVAVAVPGADLCVRCHTTADSRPSFLPQITPAEHYTDGCLDCHDPHSGISNAPPTVSHPLEDLPACIVCHGPDGFRARTARHPEEPTEDAVCLRCHAPGRGEIDVREPAVTHDDRGAGE